MSMKVLERRCLRCGAGNEWIAEGPRPKHKGKLSAAGARKVAAIKKRINRK